MVWNNHSQTPNRFLDRLNTSNREGHYGVKDPKKEKLIRINSLRKSGKVYPAPGFVKGGNGAKNVICGSVRKVKLDARKSVRHAEFMDYPKGIKVNRG